MHRHPLIAAALVVLVICTALPCAAAGMCHPAKAAVATGERLAAPCAGITRADATHHTITRERVRATMENLAALSRTLRLVVAADNGVVRGYRLAWLRRDSLAACLGFKRGDVVLAVNDLGVAEPDLATQGYATIVAADVVRFSLLRKGRPLLLTVAIE